MWAERLKELDEHVAKNKARIIRQHHLNDEFCGGKRELSDEKILDGHYRNAFSTGTRIPLKKGETWRGRIVKYAEREKQQMQSSKARADKSSKKLVGRKEMKLKKVTVLQYKKLEAELNKANTALNKAQNAIIKAEGVQIKASERYKKASDALRGATYVTGAVYKKRKAELDRANTALNKTEITVEIADKAHDKAVEKYRKALNAIRGVTLRYG